MPPLSPPHTRHTTHICLPHNPHHPRAGGPLAGPSRCGPAAAAMGRRWGWAAGGGRRTVAPLSGLRWGGHQPTNKQDQQKIEDVESFLTENRGVTLHKAAPQISSSVTTVWSILRYDLNFNFNRLTSVQPLSDSHVQQRLQFCEWLLAQPEDFVQKIIWTDEKWFCLHQKPHRKNYGEWSRNNPRQIIETNDRNDQKVPNLKTIHTIVRTHLRERKKKGTE